MCSDKHQLTRYCLLAADQLSPVFVESMICPVSADTDNAVVQFVPKGKPTRGAFARVLGQHEPGK